MRHTLLQFIDKKLYKGKKYELSLKRKFASKIITLISLIADEKFRNTKTMQCCKKYRVCILVKSKTCYVKEVTKEHSY